MQSRGPDPTDNNETLHDFVTGIVGEESLRVEEDLGHGYVRIKSSEAERRQAIQDIQSTEDIVLEMLRNARDAGARNIFLAYGREGKIRTIVMIDDGCGIPHDYHERIFQPRVTSKLDSARLDRWGIHGRGMALYSIASNADYSQVQKSLPDLGTSIKVKTDTDRLSERVDQSTFPIFERTESGFSMRGPKNILRTVAEFALEHRESINVFCGSDTEIVASLYEHGIKEIPAAKRLFDASEDGIDLTQFLSLSKDEEQLARRSAELGLPISIRSARRVLDGHIAPVSTMLERLQSESFPQQRCRSERPDEDDKGMRRRSSSTISLRRHPKIAREDLDALESDIMEPLSGLADRYYMDCGKVSARQRGSKVVIELELIEKNS